MCVRTCRKQGYTREYVQFVGIICDKISHKVDLIAARESRVHSILSGRAVAFSREGVHRSAWMCNETVALL